MKIRAIRLKEVGRFREPVALEGLSGGLDVLAGPNELGKSTILKALKSALFYPHTSKHGRLEALRPYAGGAPLVEVDFEAGGETWRIRKQFLSARSAELKSLSSGSVARGGDAETQLSQLLAGPGRFALLWAEQGTPLALPDPAVDKDGAVMAVIEAQVENVADGGAARLVQEKVKEELAGLVTSHNPPRPSGRYKVALGERDGLERDRDEARARLARVRERLDRLQGVRDEIAQLAGPEAAAQRAEAAAAAKRAFEEADVALKQCRSAEQARLTQQERVGTLTAALANLEGQISDLAKLEEAARHDAPALEDLSRRLGDEEARVEAFRKKRDELKTAVEAALRQAKAYELAMRLDELAERLADARSAAEARKGLAEELAANHAEDALLVAARREAQAIGTITARLNAAAPKVSIAYAPGAAGKITVDGRPLQDGETLSTSRPLALEIAGIGTITVAPGQSGETAADEEDKAAHEAQLADLLDKIGAGSIAEAEALGEDRRALQERLTEAAANLRALAPDGVERLQKVHDDLAGQLRSAGGVSADTQEDLAERVQTLKQDLETSEEDLVLAVSARDELRVEHAKLRERVGQQKTRIGQLTGALGEASAREARRTELSAKLTEAQSALNAAVRDLAAWREKAPGEARVVELRQAAQEAEEIRANADRRLAALNTSEAGIEGELKSDRADDVAARLAELEEACAAAAQRVGALEAERDALLLLDRELSAAASETRDRFAKPVLDRLRPYLDLVFPQARLTFGDGLRIETLERDGGQEMLPALSEGTQEQLAVLVRLGFGRLLAESGTPAPLILDDALVYADDQRIARLFSALQLAADSHQVLVLTCRERTFETLKGNRVAITPWTGA